MGRRQEHAAVLAGLPTPDWPAHLLAHSGLPARAVAVCDAVTAAFVAIPAAARAGDDVRALRKALGYCWSVAVAADPGPGMARFAPYLGADDRDVRWIVQENLKKARMRGLLEH